MEFTTKFWISTTELLPRSSRPEVFCKKDILRNFTKFTGKHLCQSLFFNKAARASGCFCLIVIMNSFIITERCKNQWIYQWICDIQNMKVILLKFVKDHCFWTFWTLNYVDCIPFHSIDSFHIVHNQAKQFKEIFFSNFRKAWSNLHFYGSGPIKSVLFICPSLCLSICDAFFSGCT